MIKKLVLAVVALTALGAVYVVDPGGHVSTLTSYVTEWFKPGLNYQIRRADKLIGKLGKSIEANQEFLAREKVELAKFGESLDKDKVALQRKREHVVALRTQFGKGEQLVSLAPGKSNELARELSQLKIMDRKYETGRKIIDARQERFASLRDKVNEMRNSQETMKLRLEEMKAELEAVRMHEAQAGHYSVDDSDFKAAEELLGQIDTDVKTRKAYVEMRNESSSETPVSTPAVDNSVLQDVDAYLSASK